MDDPCGRRAGDLAHQARDVCHADTVAQSSHIGASGAHSGSDLRRASCHRTRDRTHVGPLIRHDGIGELATEGAGCTVRRIRRDHRPAVAAGDHQLRRLLLYHPGCSDDSSAHSAAPTAHCRWDHWAEHAHARGQVCGHLEQHWTRRNARRATCGNARTHRDSRRALPCRRARPRGDSPILCAARQTGAGRQRRHTILRIQGCFRRSGGAVPRTGHLGVHARLPCSGVRSPTFETIAQDVIPALRR